MKALLLAAVLLFSGTAPAFAESIVIDTSLTKNKTDFAISIVCDSENIWAALYKQGIIVKVGNETSFYDDPKGAMTAGQDFYQLVEDDGRLYTTDSMHGLLWRFDIETEEWASAPLIEKIEGMEYPRGYEVDPSLVKTGNHMFDSGMASFAGMAFADGYLWVGLEYNVAGTQFIGLAKVDPDSLDIERIPIDGMVAPQFILADGSALWISDRWNDQVWKFENGNAIIVAGASQPVALAQNESTLFVAVSDGILQIDKSTLESTLIEAGRETFGLSLADNLLFWTGEHQVGIVDLETGLQSIEDVETRNNFFACASGNEWFYAAEGSAIIGVHSMTVPAPEPEPELPTEPEASIEEPQPIAENESDREPPSKKGLGLSIVLSCAFSNENCEQIATLEADVVDWIGQSNFANWRVLQVLEQYAP